MSSRLGSLRVERFRQLKDLTISELGGVNLIVGGNNTGKSTLLDALRFYASKAAPSLLEEILVSHGEYQSAQHEPGVDTWPERSLSNLFSGRRFPSEDGSPICVGDIERRNYVALEHILLREELEEREIDGEVTSLRRLRRVPKGFSEAGAEVIESVEITSSPSLHQLLSGSGRVVRISLGDFFGRRRVVPKSRYEEGVVPYPHSYVPCRFNTQDALAEAWDEVVLTDGENLAIESLRIIERDTQALAFVQVTRPRINRASGSGGRMVDERIAMLKLQGVDAPVPLQAMGDGMARVLQLVLSALRAGSGMLLVDEIENGLHFSVQQRIWELMFTLAEQNGLQIFATTHSYDCVKAFSAVAISRKQVDGRLLRMERMSEGGESVASNVSEQALSDLVDAQIEVR